jgi:hypothetical protein
MIHDETGDLWHAPILRTAGLGSIMETTVSPDTFTNTSRCANPGRCRYTSLVAPVSIIRYPANLPGEFQWPSRAIYLP